MSAPLLAADSGPLIALARVDLLHLPALLYKEVLVPAAVWDEVVRQPPPAELQRLRAALDGGHLRLQPETGALPQALEDRRLGAGERSAIGLALARGAEVLIDERRGRQAALGQGLHVVGTIGLMVRGRQLKLIGPVRPAIDTLLGSGYHLTDSLTARALTSLGE
jgi:predicted nucleic acid-binding protein